MRKITATVTIALATLLVFACSNSSREEEKSERPAVAVDVARVAPGTVTESIDVVGALTPKFQSDVKTEYSGTISDVYVTEWVRVKRGTLLARFDRREAESIARSATAARIQAEANASRAHRELERTEKLKSIGLATQQNLDDAHTAAEASSAQLAAARAQEAMAQTRLSKTEVRAPMDGVIASRSVNPGDFIENMGSPRPMFRIVDNSRLELTVPVPSSQIGSVRLGNRLSFTTDAVPNRTFEGRVSFINPAADEASRTVKVVAVVDNADDALKSGLFAKGSIVTGSRSGVLSVPRTAMLTWDPTSRSGAVYVVASERAQRREVKTGAAAADTVEIESGLASGESVVTRGAFNLRDGDRVTTAQPGV